MCTLKSLLLRMKKSVTTPIAAAALFAVVGATAINACPSSAVFSYDDGHSLWCTRIAVVDGMCLMDCAVVRTGGGQEMI